MSCSPSSQDSSTHPGGPAPPLVPRNVPGRGSLGGRRGSRAAATRRQHTGLRLKGTGLRRDRDQNTPGGVLVPVPPEPRALQPQTCVLPPGGRGSTAPPASQAASPRHIPWHKWRGWATRVGGTVLGGGRTGHPAHLSRRKLSSPDPPLFLPLFLCLLCLRLTHSGPYTASPNPEPLPLSWMLGTLLDTRQIWSLVCTPAEL